MEGVEVEEPGAVERVAEAASELGLRPRASYLLLVLGNKSK